MFSPIRWSPIVKIDKQFAYLHTINTSVGNFNTTNKLDINYKKSFFHNGIIFHDTYKILYRAGSVYFGTRGKFLLMNHWTSEHDDDVKYFQDNFEQSPYPLKELLTNIHFDWNERIFYRVINMSLRPTDVWVDANMDWNFCFGSLARYEIAENNSKLISITDKDKYSWKNKTIKMNQLQSFEYIKPTDALMAYIIILDGTAKINSIEAPENFIGSIQTNSIVVENVDSPVVLIREKYDTV